VKEPAPEEPSVHWLIDGMNLIGSRPDRWWQDRRGAMTRLVERLEDYSRASGEAISVFFDGKPFDLADEGTVEVVFARHRGANAADYEIEHRVKSLRDRSALRVVTSDKRLAEAVREQGAAVVSAGSFRSQLDALGS
jgi:predicted RNA-binding protein with PIN domain